jgi:asparagine synthase (glutamine-hydrolysing)
MSAQFGRWNFDGKPVDRDYLEKVTPLLHPYGPDDHGSYAKGNISILYRAFHTTKESRRETQPFATASGAILTWDGRLDNRDDLIRQLCGTVRDAIEVEIVAAAYDYWGSDCFAKLVGDWALSIWDPRTNSLLLAKDPIGPRHLYYSLDKDQVSWSTILDPLVLFAEKSFSLCEEYIAGWFSFFPAAHLTPYVGIQAVPASCYVLIRAGKCTVAKYWNFDPSKRICYKTDTEYEEHFRAVFGEAVRRRLRSDSPILAELSGGMDSSSIVCMADTIIAQGSAETPRLDTLSYYDDSEPNLNERPYFTKVEEQRGRTGCHIDVSGVLQTRFEEEGDRFAATPSSDNGCQSTASQHYARCIASQGNRVVLSGIGGDEVTGGVPTPTPELQDLIATGQFRPLAHQLKLWAICKRKPWFHVFFDAAREFLPSDTFRLPEHKRPARWLNKSFVKRNRRALQGYDTRLKLLGPLPTFQQNVSTLAALRRQLACDPLPATPCYEKRYPYLDRTLLEFMYLVPREQLVRPGQRRSLMRRALVGIVPDEILNRRRKAFVVRGPMTSIAANWASLATLTRHMASESFGIVDSRIFLNTLTKVRQGQELALITVMRTLAIEEWMVLLRRGNYLNTEVVNESPLPLEAPARRSPANSAT